MSGSVSEEDLKARLAGKMSDSEVEELISRYVEVSAEYLPDQEGLAAINKKPAPTDVLRVGFRLTQDEYDALRDHFDGETSATALVQRGIAEFVKSLQ